MSLHVARGIDLPDEVATHKNAILAMSGAGKSNAAVVLAEEMHHAGIPWVAIDPKGDWFGIRARSDGKGEGLPIPVLGGLHGDIPLEPTAGKLIANLIAERHLSCVLDTSEFDTREEQFRFLADFGETLLRRNRSTLHLFLEEADEYLPQQARDKGSLPRCLGAWLRVVKRGRVHGLGCTLISQRSAAIHKDVLNQADTLIAMRVTAPRDRKAIEEWIVGHALGAELADSLPSLEDGEAWIWSPQKLKMATRVRFRRRATFDSGATPDVLGHAVKVASLADVDLDALKDQMAETIARAKADDPRLLQARICELERELAARPTVEPETIVETVTERIEVPVLDVELVARLEELLQAPAELLGEVQETLLKQRMYYERGLDQPPAASTVRSVASSTAALERRDGILDAPRTAPARSPKQPVESDSALGKAERAVLTVLAQYPDGRTRAQVAFLTGYSPTTSTLSVVFGGLRKLGYMTPSAPLQATDAGVAALGTWEPLPVGRALLDYWMGKLGKAEQLILRYMLDVYPATTTRDEVAAATGYSAQTSTLSVALGKLRRVELVDGWKVDDDFVDAIR